MALTSQRSRTSRTLRRLSLKLGTLVIAALAVTMALGLVAPAAGQAAVSVLRLGHCGGAEWETTTAPDRTHLYVPITHYNGYTSRCSGGAEHNSPSTYLLSCV